MPHLAPPTRRSRIEYPGSDGEPMAETDLHLREMMALIAALMHRYHDQRNVYVAGDNFIYYEEGNPRARFSPDAYVVFGVPKKERRVYKLWEEKRAPAVVFEVTSSGTKDEDTGKKKTLCASLGVEEYFLYDPEGEYLHPPLQGCRLKRGGYTPIEPQSDGALISQALRLRLQIEDTGLRLIDTHTGERLMRASEAFAAVAELRAEIERLKGKRK